MYSSFTDIIEDDPGINLTHEQIKKRRRALVCAASVITKMCDNYTNKDDDLHIRMPDIKDVITVLLLILLALYVYVEVV